MALAVNALKEQIERAKESLKSVDENIKKITGRDPSEQRPNEGRRLSTGAGRGRGQGGVLGRRGLQNRAREAEPPAKKPASNEVFSRLGPAGGRRRVIISGGRGAKEPEEEEEEVDEDDEVTVKPAVQSSVVSTAKKITKSELINAQNVGERGKARNRRMFGVLLGTLARFQTDAGSVGRQTKQAQRQQEIERKLDEQLSEERKKLATERRTLFNVRRAQQRRIQLLEEKVALANELVEWEKEWVKKSKFIMTKASPPVFFSPKDTTPATQRALKDSTQRIQDIIVKHRKSVEDTMKLLDDEINLLENKLEAKDGKGGDNGTNGNAGGEGVKGSEHPNGRERVEEPEEEMDLDSMGPQVDIKVEMDDTEGGEGKENDINVGGDVKVIVKKELVEEPVSNDQNQNDQDDAVDDVIDNNDKPDKKEKSSSSETAQDEHETSQDEPEPPTVESTPDTADDPKTEPSEMDMGNTEPVATVKEPENAEKVELPSPDKEQSSLEMDNDARDKETPIKDSPKGKASDEKEEIEGEKKTSTDKSNKNRGDGDFSIESEGENEKSGSNTAKQIETKGKPSAASEHSSSDEEGPVKGPVKKPIPKKRASPQRKIRQRRNVSSESSSSSSSSDDSSSSEEDSRRKFSSKRRPSADDRRSTRHSTSHRSKEHTKSHTSSSRRSRRSSSRSRSRDRHTSRREHSRRH